MRYMVLPIVEQYGEEQLRSTSRVTVQAWGRLSDG